MLHLDYGTLTPVLKKLDQMGYLIRERSAEDERILIIKLTSEGRDVKDKAVSVPIAMANCMGLSLKEYETLYKLTYKALSNMEHNSNN